MKKVKKCILCKNNKFKNLPYYYIYLDKRINMVECTRCHLITLSPILSKNEVNNLYDIDYFKKDYNCLGVEKRYISTVSEIKENFKRNQLRKIKRFVRTGRVLEIGCAGGGAY